MDSKNKVTFSPDQARRLEAIVRTQRQADELVESQQNLLKNELERQEVENRLTQLTQQVDNDLEEVGLQFNNMGIGIDQLKASFSTPPSTPTRARTTNLASNPVSPPGTPNRHTTVASPPPSSRPPKGTTLKPSATAEPVCPGSRNPAYVLYQGKDGTHGVFYAWATHKNVIGAKDFYDNDCHHHVVRSFSSRELAHKFYNEFVDTGIPELLAEMEPSEDEHFIVVEGVKPMACKTRKSLIMDSLQYRGGVAYRFVGDMGSAWAKFNELKEADLVKTTHTSRTKF